MVINWSELELKKLLKLVNRGNLIEKYGVPAAVVIGIAIVGVALFAFSQAATGPQLYTTPATSTVISGSDLAITVRADSQAELVNSVQASLGYDASQLQFIGLSETGPFSFVAASDTTTPGRVRVARAVPSGGAPVSGDNAVVTINFKVLATTGTVAVDFDNNFSLLVSSSTSSNVLAGTTGSSFTISGANQASATMTLAPATSNVTSGTTYVLTLKENSGTALVNSIQSTIGYDATKLQFLSISEGNTFTNQAATDTATPGRIRVARSLTSGSGGVSGSNDVVTITFKLLATAGTSDVTINKAESLVVTSIDNKDILSTVAGSTVTAVNTPPTGQPATLSMSPTTGTFAEGSTVSVVVKADSPTAPLTTIQSVISYPENQLQYVNTTEGGVFTTVQRTNATTPGVVDIIRGVQGGQAGVTGENPVVTINFKVIGTAGAAALNLTNSSAIYDNTGTGVSILNFADSTGASYVISGATSSCTANPSTPGAPSRTTFGYTSIAMSWAASNPGANCTVAGYHVLRNGVNVANVTNGSTFTDTGLTAGISYSYTIQAYDTTGHNSAMSAAASLSSQPDDQAPTTPAGVTASALTASSVSLSWTASNDLPNPGGSGVAGYYIYRNNSTQPTYTVATGTTYSDSNVTANTSYSYTIAAFDVLNNVSAPSNVVTARTASPTCSGSPSVPSGLSMTSSSLTGVEFSWNSSNASAGCTLAGYKVYRGNTLVGTVTETSFGDIGLTPNTLYNYSVQSYDTSAHTSASSTVLTIATAADMTAPAAPDLLTASVVSSGRVDLSWNASTDNVGVTGYNLYRNGQIIRSFSATTLSFSDTLVTQSTDYNYQISAFDVSGNESSKTSTSPASIHTPASVDTQAPTVPTNLRSLATSTSSIVVAWGPGTDNTAVAGYHVYRDGQLIADMATLNFTDTGLNPDTAYTYTVKAFDAAGNSSSNSNSLQVSTLTPPVTILVGDLNSDEKVGIYDLSIMLKHWREIDVPPRSGDINRDGLVDEHDLEILLNHYGEVE